MTQWDEKTEDNQHDDDFIKGFTSDEYRWLSNFYSADVEFEGLIFPSTEHAYQAAKCFDPERRKEFITLTAGQAKKLGRKVEVRADWDNVKCDVMETVLRSKFTRHADLREKLLATGDKYLEETNWWGDTYWGVCRGVGMNMLGCALMKIRRELQTQTYA
jgi:ribA/ribD-fused uncharacterized protein